jgi:hypothetical protein
MSDDESDFEFLPDTDEEAELEEAELEEAELEEIENTVPILDEELEVPDEITYEMDYKKNKYKNGIKNYKDALMRKFAEGGIDDKQYFTELLELELFENSQLKTVAITQTGLDLIKEINDERVIKKEQFTNGDISKDEYDRYYIDSLRQEKTVIQRNKATLSSGLKIKFDVSDPTISMKDKLDYLIKKEDQLVQKLAKKHSIKLRKPSIKASQSADERIRNKFEIENEIYQNSRNYILQNYVEGYKIKTLNPTSLGNLSYEIEEPIIKDFNEIVKTESKKKLISELDELDQEQSRLLKKELRKLSKSDLIRCLESNGLVANTSTYIQRLKDNKVPILKFQKYPNDKEELDKVLTEEFSDYYSVNRDLIKNPYTYKNDTQSTDIVSIPGSKISFKVPFKGVSRNYVGKVIQLKLSKIIKAKSFENLSNYYEPVIPVPDELYKKIEQSGELEDKVVEVYQLHTKVPGFEEDGVQITKRYTDFEEYLKDYRIILAKNLISIESGDSPDKLVSVNILKNKISKIDDYLTNNTDPDVILETSEYKSELVESKIEEVREESLKELISYILKYNHLAFPKVESLEEYNYNKHVREIVEGTVVTTEFRINSYKENIKRILFVISNYPDILVDYLNGIISPNIIVDYEIPLNYPNLQEPGNLEELLGWNPPSEYYDMYKDYLSYGYKAGETRIEALRRNLMKDSINLDSKQLKLIIEQENEVLMWEEHKKQVLAITQFPSHFTEENWKYKQLKKHKNRLPSQIIFRVTDVDTRIKNISKFNRLFSDCNIENPLDISKIVESIIFNKSRLYKDYDFYVNMILTDYTDFCKYLTKLSPTKIDIINFIVIITEYFFKNGNKLIINEEKVKSIIIAIANDNLEVLLDRLSIEEIEIYNKSILETAEIYPDTNKKLNLMKNVTIFLFKLRRNINRKYIESVNKYVKPHIELVKPETNNYIFYEGKYIVGGIYPSYESPYGVQNYSENDLKELCEIVGVIYTTHRESYFSAMNKISELRSASEKNIPMVKLEERLLPFLTYSKPRVKIQYTVRPRFGVAEPGEVYLTSKTYIKEYQKEYPTNRDYFERQYGVPYKYENYIPVYHSKLKELVDEKFIIIEGPAVFKSPVEDELARVITSPYHIFVEYKDQYGKIKYFREGVSEKKVITTFKDSLDTCNRFKNESDCNKYTSYSLDGKKCYFIEGKCKSSLVNDMMLTNKDVWDYVPEVEEYKKPWAKALVTASKYIEDKSKTENLGEIGLSKLIQSQTKQLYKFRKELEKMVPKSKPLIQQDDRLIEIVKSLSTDTQPVQSVTIPENYKLITIKTIVTEFKSRQMTTSEILELSEYKDEEHGDLKVIDVETYPEVKQSLVKLEKPDGERLLLSRNNFRVKEILPTISVKPERVYIKNEDYALFKNPPASFTWKLDKLNFEDINLREEEVEYITNDVSYIDTTMIKPTGNINGIRVINKGDIEKAMIELAFSHFIERDDQLILKDKINAKPDSIKLALDENISLNLDYFKFIVARDITVDDVIKFIEKDIPKAENIVDLLKERMEYALKEEDIPNIKKLLKDFEKAKLDTTEYFNKLKQLEEKRERPKEIKEDIQVVPKEVKSIKFKKNMRTQNIR